MVVGGIAMEMEMEMKRREVLECGVKALSLVQLAAVIGECGWSFDVATRLATTDIGILGLCLCLFS